MNYYYLVDGWQIIANLASFATKVIRRALPPLTFPDHYNNLPNFEITTLSRGGGSHFPYILLNEIQTMFSQLAKRSSRVSPADLCTDHAHYVLKKNMINNMMNVFQGTSNKNMAVQGRTVSHYFILVIRKCIDFLSLLRQRVVFFFF